MALASLEIRCAACGRALDSVRELPFRCPDARDGDDCDHLLTLIQKATPEAWPVGADPNPFKRFAGFSASWGLAASIGLSSQEYATLVADLDASVAAVDGAGFRTTPYLRNEELGVWIKDETGSVAGSHKARHLMGVALYMHVAARVPALHARLANARLAIASCGNAALAAATLAAAMEREIDVYIPTWADAETVELLSKLGAKLHTCERLADSPPGDPCYHAFLAALAAGAIPFACQGSRCGLAIDGGRTLAWELAEQHRKSGARPLDRLFVQVGGGALASSVLQGLGMACDAQVIPEMPALHAVQVEGAEPLVRAWRLLARELAGEEAEDHVMAARIRAERSSDETHDAWRAAARRRADYMWPVEAPPASAASGILDDETYDGFAVLLGMLLTGGWPVVVDEEEIRRAHGRGRAASGLDVSATGTAGLAGYLSLRDAGLTAADEAVAVLFTGVQR